MTGVDGGDFELIHVAFGLVKDGDVNGAFLFADVSDVSLIEHRVLIKDESFGDLRAINSMIDADRVFTTKDGNQSVESHHVI